MSTQSAKADDKPQKPNWRLAERSGAGYHTFKLETFREFTEAAAEVTEQKNPKHEYVWRGATNPNWQLLSSLSRAFQTSSPKPRHATSAWLTEHLYRFVMDIRGIDDYADMYRDVLPILEEKLEVKGVPIEVVLAKFAEPQLKALCELFALGQHHHLKTPLLDWTTAPFVALYFAFEEQDDRDEVGYRAVYALNRTLVEEEWPRGSSIQRDSIRFIESLAHRNGRILGQSGLFTLLLSHRPLEERITEQFERRGHEPVLQRFLIRNTERHQCLKWLQTMNIHARALFPDIEGAARACNYRLEQSLKSPKKGDGS